MQFVGQFIGQFIAATVRSLLSVFGLIFGLRLSQQFTNLLLQPDLLGLHAVVTHGLVSRRIRFDLRPVQRQPSHLEQPRRRRQSQHFDEQLLKRGDVTTTKFTDRVPVFFYEDRPACLPRRSRDTPRPARTAA